MARLSEPSPYVEFDRTEWRGLRMSTPLKLTEEELTGLRGLGEQIDLLEVEEVFLPLARLIHLQVAARQALFAATDEFLGEPRQNPDRPVPFVIGVAGSVAVGKSTTARVLQALLSRWDDSHRVDLVTTDGFLYPNAELTRRNLMHRKGFPESYDRPAFIKFLSDIKSGRPNVGVPVYSHLFYDIVPGEEIIIDRPDILIVEGLNILQPGELPKSGRPILFASDFLDFSIFIDASEADLTEWFMARFRALRQTAFADPNSFFHRFSKMSEKEAEDFGMWAWTEINLPNLRDNILPTRSRADLVLTKGASHTIERVALRKV